MSSHFLYAFLVDEHVPVQAIANLAGCMTHSGTWVMELSYLDMCLWLCTFSASLYVHGSCSHVVMQLALHKKYRIHLLVPGRFPPVVFSRSYPWLQRHSPPSLHLYLFLCETFLLLSSPTICVHCHTCCRAVSSPSLLSSINEVSWTTSAADHLNSDVLNFHY